MELGGVVFSPSQGLWMWALPPIGTPLELLNLWFLFKFFCRKVVSERNRLIPWSFDQVGPLHGMPCIYPFLYEGCMKAPSQLFQAGENMTGRPVWTVPRHGTHKPKLTQISARGRPFRSETGGCAAVESVEPKDSWDFATRVSTFQTNPDKSYTELYRASGQRLVGDYQS